MTPPEPETPLSAAEKRRLEQLERQLVVQFPDLDDALRDGRRVRRWLPTPEIAIAAVLALGLLAAAVVVGGIGLAVAELAAMGVTAVAVVGVPILIRRRAGAAPGTGTPAQPTT